MRTEREDLGLLGNKQTEHNEGIVLYVLSETDFTDYLIYIYIYIYLDTILPLKSECCSDGAVFLLG